MFNGLGLIQRAAVFAAAVCACWQANGADYDIEFGFNDKPPLFHFVNGEATGELVDVVRDACKLAALNCRFTYLPFQRVMFQLEHRRAAFAALGFSKTPEREKFVTFSEPIWLDASPVLLVRAADKKGFQDYASFADVVARSSFTFGGVTGNVYPIDEHLRRMAGRDKRFAVEAARLPLLLVANRFDFTMLYPAEVLPALQVSAVLPQAVSTVVYPDLPRGGERYVLFSKAVSSDIIARLNGAIQVLRRTGKISTLR